MKSARGSWRTVKKKKNETIENAMLHVACCLLPVLVSVESV